jgi:hypothetical protein
MENDNGNSSWSRSVVGWVIGILIATVPQALIFTSKFSVLYDRSNRIQADIQMIQAKGSDPVQILTTTVALVKQEQNEFKDRLIRFERNQEVMMSDQAKMMTKIEQHLAQSKPISMDIKP